MNVDNILEYQRKIIKYANSSNQKGMLMYHSLQDNTILTSVLLSMTVYNKFNVKNSSILIVCSSLNIHRYINYIRSLNFDMKLFEFLNYKQFNFLINENNSYCKNKIVVIDKIHYYRNPSVLTHNMIKALGSSLYNLLITSVVFVNGTDDIISIIAILHRISWDKAKKLYIEARSNKNTFDKIFKGFVSYHNLTPSEEKKTLKIYENNIELTYTDKDMLEYLPIENWFLLQKENGEYKKTVQKIKNSDSSSNIKQEKRTNLRQFILDFKTTVNNKVKDENKISWILNKIITQFQEKKNKTIVYFSKDSDKINFINELKKYNLQFIDINSNMSYESQKSFIQRFNKSKIYILILSNINTDISWFIPNIRTLFVFEPQIDNSNIISLKDDLINSYKYNKGNTTGSEKKSLGYNRLDIFTLISKKPKKNKGFISFVKKLFIDTKSQSIDQLIQDKNEKSKTPIKIYKKQLKAISI